MIKRPIKSAVIAIVATLLLSLATIGAAGATPKSYPSTSARFEKVCGAVGIGYARCLAETLVNPSTWEGSHAKPSPTPSTIAGYYPSDLQSAYALTSASTNSGGSQTVAIVDAYNNPYLAANLQTYRTNFSLGSCTTSSGCLGIVNQSGGNKLPHNNSGWGTEESLDLDMVSAICPNCKILLVEASSNSLSNLATAAAYAAKHAQVVSNSYGGSEFSSETSFNSYYTSSNAVFVVSSGDSGYGVQFPAAAPNVVAAGGTTLTTSTDARGWTETAWSGAGSGCSAYESNPGWEPMASFCITNRNVADVSADADPNTGVAMYDTYGQTGWIVVGGTSVASPIIASVYALNGNASTLGAAAATSLYSSSASLFRVTNGSNSTNCPANDYLCNAADSISPGYNGPTGNGTPNGTTSF